MATQKTVTLATARTRDKEGNIQTWKLEGYPPEPLVCGVCGTDEPTTLYAGGFGSTETNRYIRLCVRCKVGLINTFDIER